MPAGNNPSYDGWNNFASLLQKYKLSQFTLDIELPYTFAFTPEWFGGVLKNATDAGNGAFAVEEGIELQFYWYIDSWCEILEKVDVISTDYRITLVTHNIGLNGNTTQIKLSHLSVSGT
jgi:hypothetical protein